MRLLVLILVVISTATAGLDAQTVVVRGTVTNELNDRGISAVSVVFADQVVTTTDANGAFETPPLAAGNAEFVLSFRRLGFAPQATELARRGSSALTVNITMRPIPTRLEEIVVDGSSITIRNPGLIGFYQRREEGRGRYLTQMDIDRAKSFDLSFYFQYRLQLQTVARGCTAFDRNVVYVDGIRWFDQVSVNQMFAPMTIGGIEVYGKESIHLLPREFIPAGPVCTVMMIWTREPLPPSAMQFGMYAGPKAAGSGSAQSFLGGQIVFPLRQGTSTLKLRAGYAASVSGQGDRWQATIGMSINPTGYGSNWYTGGGLALTKGALTAGLTPRPMLLSGVFGRLGLLRPFGEARLIGSRVFIVAGLNVLLGPE